ncbi:hypothetical protein SUDANB1_05237 [Streptomyces sp. enrichment culture]
MCRAVRRARKTLGRRGEVLIILGIGKVVWGLGYIVDPPPDRGLEMLTSIGPLQSWAWLWIVAGVVTGGSAILPAGRDRWGFVAAQAPPTVWAVAYAVGFLSGVYSRGIFPFVFYMTHHVALIVWASKVREETPYRSTARPGAARGPG